MESSCSMVAPLVSKSRPGGRRSAARSSSASSPVSTSRMTWAATSVLVMLAMDIWSSGTIARSPAAMPVAPLQVPSGVNSAAVTPCAGARRLSTC